MLNISTKPWKRSLLFLLVLGFTASVSFGQGKTIKGVVSSQDEGPLPGVNIVIQGTQQGTMTGPDGSYTIQVPGPQTVLEFSFISYAKQTITVGDQTTINVTLVPEASTLNEVVVVGYGTQRKKDVTGAVSNIKADDFNRGVINNPAQLIEGKAPGVMITSSSGDPGANAAIRIRGNSSVRAGNNPLIVVDGVPLSGGNTTADADLQTLGNSSARNPMNFINSSDIASIDILKDASATAIYGSRGANGVILITTKQGAAGSNGIEYDGSVSMGSIAHRIKLYNAAEFATLAPAQNQGGDVNALDAILRTSVSHNHNLAFKGGNEDLRYRLSLGAQDQQGIIKESGLKKYTANLNVAQDFFKDRLMLSSNLIYSVVNDSYAPIATSSGYEGSLIGNALVWNPTRNFYTADGDYDQFSQGDSNPLAVLAYTDDKARTERFLGNFSATLNIIENLNYKVNLGVDRSNSRRSVEISSLLNRIDIIDRGYAGINDLISNSFLIEHTLNYDRNFGSNVRFTGLLGYSYQTFTRLGNSLSGRDFEYNEVPYLNQLQSISQANRDVSSFNDPETKLQSYFGRVNLNAFEKFMLTATLRADGSSKFGANNKYGYFPSFALAYRISEESFIPEVFSDLKLRLGWGQTGNQEFPAGASQAQYQITRDGITRSQYDNPDLKWETTTTLNAGIDFAVFNDRLSGSIEYFNKNTVDLIFNAVAALPGPSGARRWTNLDATINNKGVEVGLNGVLVKGSDFTFSLGGNISFIKNILNDFKGVVETGMLHGQGISATPSQRFVNGQPLGVFYMLRFEGLDDKGLGIYSDKKEYLQDPNPKTILGITSNLAYKNLDLFINFNGAFGQYIYNNTATSVLVVSNPTKGRNSSPDYTLPGESPDNALKASTRYLEKGDYLRLNNVTLGYTLKNAPLFLKTLRLTLTGQNLFVITKYTGFDPDVNVDKNIDGVPSYGIDYTPYPSARTFAFGLSTAF
ncbi:MAG TPA: TonB-dependent receptor [Bacteroidales bacterium]|nr:TonB-dependent receptor [Bacteroidales bacterium]